MINSRPYSTNHDLTVFIYERAMHTRGCFDLLHRPASQVNMKPIKPPLEPIAPTSKNPKLSELKQYHRELKEYEKRLKRWSNILAQHESYLLDLEAEIMEVGFEDGCDCGEAGCIDSMDDDELDEARERIMASVRGGVRRSAVVAVNPGDEVNFLEKLYSLSDRRGLK